MTDASGADVPNVRVELENIDTSQRTSATTDAQGVYTPGSVAPGRYRIITNGSATGSAASQEITVDASRTNTINISMPSGPRTDVQATAEEVAVSTSPASVLDVWNARYINYLPKPNFADRSGDRFGAYNLSLLTSATVSSVPGWQGGPAIAGQRPETDLFHIDGIDNHNKLTGGPLAYLSNEARMETAGTTPLSSS